MNRILLLFAHPAFERSLANAAMLKEIKDLEGVTLHDLYSLYPDFYIDVEAEQQLCLNHDIILTQYPFYWYSSPSIIKEWTDLVFQHGWAYGQTGTKLQGKYFLQAITTGSEAETYTWGARSSMPFVHYLAPQRATARLCGMQWLPPFVASGMHIDVEPNRLAACARRYREVLTALRDSTRLTEIADRYQIKVGEIPGQNALIEELLHSRED